jgi:hypothetical protein
MLLTLPPGCTAPEGTASSSMAAQGPAEAEAEEEEAAHHK